MSVVVVPRRLRQENDEFKASTGGILKPYLKINKYPVVFFFSNAGDGQQGPMHTKCML